MCLPVKPFKVEREWKHFGLQCAVTQNREAGFRCGYVRVPPGNSFFGKAYDALSHELTPPGDVDVHGGLTFAELEPCTEHTDGQGWWFGFDCAHAGDRTNDPSAKPEDMTTEAGRVAALFSDRFSNREFPEHFWTQEEVERETERLAEQLSDVVWI
jgi:hypothetical protein